MHKFLQSSSWSAKVLQGSASYCRTKIMQYHDNLTRHIVFLQMHFFLLDKELIDSMQLRQQFWSFKTRRYFVVEYFAQLRPIEGRHKQRPQLHSSQKLLHLRRRSRVSLLFILLPSREQFIKHHILSKPDHI